MFKGRVVVAGMAVVVSALVAACGAQSQPAGPKAAAGAEAPKGEPIKVGLLAPLSGSVAFDGQEEEKGAKFAIAEINKQGGLLGRPVELAVADGKCVPAESVNAAEKLIVKDKVVAMGGAFCSSATKAVLPVLDKYKVAMVNAIASDPGLTDSGNAWFFRTKVHNGIRAKYFAKFIADNLKAKKVAMLAVNDDFGRSGVTAHKTMLEQLGASVPVVEYFEHGETNFQALLTKIRSSGADTLFLVAEVQDGALVMKQFYELGLKLPVATIGSLSTPQFFQLAGANAEGIYTAEAYADGIDNPLNKQFIEAFRKEYKADPGNYNNAGYIEMQTILDAIKRAGSTDTKAVRDAMEKASFDSTIGRVSFDAKHQARTNLYITVNKGGKAVLAASFDTAKD